MAELSIGGAILSLLAEFGEGTLDVFFPRKYSYTRIWRPFLGLERSKKVTRATVSTMLWRLKQQGLVERVGETKSRMAWQLTGAGKKHLEQAAQDAPTVRKSDGIARLVIFDVPERERTKRNIIRAELVGCGFRQLQKSVWMGNHPLPQDFITLVDDLGLAGKVHIFSIRETGTISGLA